MRVAHLLLIVNTTTCWETDLHLTNLVLHIKFHDFNTRIDIFGLSHLGSCYLLNSFTDSMGPFNKI